MTREELIKELRGYGAYDGIVDALLEHRAVMRSKLYGLGSSAPDGLPRSPQPGNKVDGLVGAIDALEREIAKWIHAAISDRMRVEGYIQKATDPRGRAVLELYYFNANPMWLVAKKMNYAERQCWRFHNAAIKDILKTWHTVSQLDVIE